MTQKDKDTFKVGRDAITGRFITVEEAERRGATAVVETIRKARSSQNKTDATS